MFLQSPDTVLEAFHLRGDGIRVALDSRREVLEETLAFRRGSFGNGEAVDGVQNEFEGEQFFSMRMDLQCQAASLLLPLFFVPHRVSDINRPLLDVYGNYGDLSPPHLYFLL